MQVVAQKSGASYNPTTDVVKIACPVQNIEPIAADWKNGTWDTTVDGDYIARIMIGPGGDITPAVGVYDILINVVDSPESPILRAGTLRIVPA